MAEPWQSRWRRRLSKLARQVLYWTFVVVFTVGGYLLFDKVMGGDPEDARMQRRIIRG